MDSVFLSILKTVDEFAISSNSIELKNNRLTMSQVPQSKKIRWLYFFALTKGTNCDSPKWYAEIKRNDHNATFGFIYQTVKKTRNIRR